MGDICQSKKISAGGYLDNRTSKLIIVFAYIVPECICNCMQNAGRNRTKAKGSASRNFFYSLINVTILYKLNIMTKDKVRSASNIA